MPGSKSSSIVNLTCTQVSNSTIDNGSFNGANILCSQQGDTMKSTFHSTTTDYLDLLTLRSVNQVLAKTYHYTDPSPEGFIQDIYKLNTTFQMINDGQQVQVTVNLLGTDMSVTTTINAASTADEIQTFVLFVDSQGNTVVLTVPVTCSFIDQSGQLIRADQLADPSETTPRGLLTQTGSYQYTDDQGITYLLDRNIASKGKNLGITTTTTTPPLYFGKVLPIVDGSGTELDCHILTSVVQQCSSV